MPEKIIPDVEFFENEINKEFQENLTMQRARIAERLINFSSEKMSELHLQDWYSSYWKLVNLLQFVENSKEQTKEIVEKIKPLISQAKNSVHRQYFALAFLLLGDSKEFRNLSDQNLWSEKLREDFNAFSILNGYTILDASITRRAHIRRNQQIKKFLQDKYSDLVKKYSNSVINDRNCPKVAQKDYKIYFCWLQGEENLPPLIQCCYNSLKQNAGKYKIVFIDENNFSDYVTLPEYIIKKFKDGKISSAHFSDVIRINLLEQSGGLWLDSTVLVTEPLENYKHFWKLPYYTQKFFQEKSNFCPFISTPSYGRWAGFIQGTAILHNPLFAFEKEFYNEYWREFDEIIDYVLMDYMMDMAYENIPAVKKFFDSVPINNDKAWNLLGMLELPYAQCPYDKILKGNFLNKLNWKNQLNWQKPDTVLKEIQRRYAPETLGE